MDKEIISQYLYDEYTKEYSGVKEWGKPPYKEWLEQKLFEAQSKSQESDSLPCVSDSFLEVVKQKLFNDWSESLISEEYDEDIPEHYWLQDMTIADMMELLKSCR